MGDISKFVLDYHYLKSPNSKVLQFRNGQHYQNPGTAPKYVMCITGSDTIASQCQLRPPRNRQSVVSRIVPGILDSEWILTIYDVLPIAKWRIHDLLSPCRLIVGAALDASQSTFVSWCRLHFFHVTSTLTRSKFRKRAFWVTGASQWNSLLKFLNPEIDCM